MISMDIQSRIWKRVTYSLHACLISFQIGQIYNFSRKTAEWIDFVLAVTIWIDFELTAFHIWDFRTVLETRVNIEASSVYKSPSILCNCFSEPNDADEVHHFHHITSAQKIILKNIPKIPKMTAKVHRWRVMSLFTLEGDTSGRGRGNN